MGIPSRIGSMNKLFVAIIFCFTTLSSAYPFRQIEHPPLHLDKHIKIVVLASDRTGSTLLYNVLNYLFEDQEGFCTNTNKRVLLLHSLPRNLASSLDPKQTILITTIRDPLDIVASRKCVYEKLTTKQYGCKDPIEDLPFPKEEALATATFRFERFYQNDFSYLFDTLEKALEITISPELQTKITSLFNYKEMRKVAKKYHDPRQSDPYLGIHGRHINRARWRNDLSYKEVWRTFKKNFALREKWGYDNCKMAIELEEFRKANDEQLR